MSQQLLGILLAGAVCIGFTGLALGDRATRPMVVIAAILSGALLVYYGITAH